MKQTIEIPDGFELVKVSDTEYQIVKKEEKLPDTWNEFCAKYPIENNEHYVTSISTIGSVKPDERKPCDDKNLLPDKKYAEAILALCQLIQLRDCYRQGWKPNYINNDTKYSIVLRDDIIVKGDFLFSNVIFSFQTAELRDKFLNNFKDLLNTVAYLWK